MYSLRLLGGVLLEGPSGPVSGRAVQRRQLALLALLACARDKGLTRDKLIGYLWPETDGERARRHLSDALYVLRRSLGEDAVVAAGEALRLDPEAVRCDVCEFEDALERGDLEVAVGLYDGAFLDGFYLGDGREFEGWVEAERARLADRYAGAVESLAERSAEAGEHRAAAEWWKRLAAHDPYNSRVMVRVVEALAAAGDPANALELARVHEIRLREELGIEPPADLAAAIERLKQEPAASESSEARREWPAIMRTEPPAKVEEVEDAAPIAGAWTLRRLVPEIHRRTLWQVLLVYAGASWAVFAVVQTLTEGLGLPGWFPAFALVFLLVGLPFVLATAFVQKGGPLSRQSESAPIPERTDPLSTRPAMTELRRLFRWRNVISGGVVALALWGFVAAGWLVFRAAPSEDATALAATTPANRVVVLPFSYRGSDEFSYLADGMVALLSRTLDGAGELRTVNPRAVFGMLSQMDDAEGVDKARALTQRLNAERHVVGEIVEVGGRLRMNARLSAPARDGEYVEATIEGPADSVLVLIDNLTAQLIVGSEGERATRLISVASATTASLEALKAFLEGERHFHRPWGRGDAFNAFRRAVEIDSTFALAWFRYSQLAYMSGMSLVEHGRAADMAARLADRLPPRERRMLEAYRAYVRGAAAESERIYREILRVYPDDVEAWFGLSLLLADYAEIHGRPRSAVRQPAERVLYYQPEHSQALWYTAIVEASEGDWAQTDSVFTRMYGDSIPLNFTAITVYGSGDPEGQEEILNKIKPYGPHWLLLTAWWVAGFSENPAGALEFCRLAEQHTEAPRWAALNHLFSASFELSLGRWRAAQEEFDRQSAHNAAWAIEDAAYWSLAPYLSVSPSELRAWRDSIARWDAEAVPPAVEPIPFWAFLTDRHEDVHPHLRLYLLGRLNARLGDGEAALRYAAELDAMETPGIPGTLSRDLAQSIRAHVLFYEGQTAGALRALETAPREVSWGRLQGSWFFTGLQDRYLRAQLLEELERYEEALPWYQSISYWPLPVMAGPAHLGQARVYERLDNHEKAAEQYARFIDLWKDADPELQPQVEAARRALEALSREM